MADWEINRPLGQCFGSGKKIEPGEDYYGALVETEQGLQRRDFSGEYWEREKPPVFCFWKTKLAAPNEKKQLFVSDDMLMAFFERLANETEAEKVSFRFVLTLVLMRKRRLKYDSAKTDAGARSGACASWETRTWSRLSIPTSMRPRSRCSRHKSGKFSRRTYEAKFEIRSSKFETSTKDRNPKSETGLGPARAFGASDFDHCGGQWGNPVVRRLCDEAAEVAGLSGQGDGGGSSADLATRAEVLFPCGPTAMQSSRTMRRTRRSPSGTLWTSCCGSTLRCESISRVMSLPLRKLSSSARMKRNSGWL